MNRVRITIAALVAAAALQVPVFAQAVSQIPVLPEQTPQLVILSTTVQSGYILHVTGRNFCDAPLVTFGGTPLAVANLTPTSFDALLPVGVQPGTYLLEVSCGHGAIRNYAIPVVIE